MKLKKSIKILIVIFVCVILAVSYIVKNSKDVIYSIQNVKNYKANESEADKEEEQELKEIDDDTLLEVSDLNNLKLNITQLPTIEAGGKYSDEGSNGDYVLSTEPNASGVVYKWISFNDNKIPWNTSLEDTYVAATFENCGTLEGEKINMKIVYSELYTAPKYKGGISFLSSYSKPFFRWCAYGPISNQEDSNEWFFHGFQSFRMQIYFYKQSEPENPITFKNAYFSVTSLDDHTFSEGAEILKHIEGTRSKTATDVFKYKNARIITLNGTYGILYSNSYNYYGNGHERNYENTYIGTADHLEEQGDDRLYSITYRFQDVDCLDADLINLNAAFSMGYHLKFSVVSATLPEEPIKTVNKTKTTAGSELKYRIEQEFPDSLDKNFRISALVFKDQLDTNLKYKSIKVFDENNNDVTNNAGTVTCDADNLLTYTFNKEYLSSVICESQIYTFEINTEVKNDIEVDKIENKTKTIINDKYELESNKVKTDVVSLVTARYVDEDGNEIADTERFEGKINEDYVTEKKKIQTYEFIRSEGETSGKYEAEPKEVVYVYRRIIPMPEEPKKTVNKTKTTAGSELKYRIEQELLNISDENYRMSDLVFKDQLDTNLKYKSIKVFDEKNNNITNSAGTVTCDADNLLTYTFKEEYLSSIIYSGQIYAFEINTEVKADIDVDKVENKAKIIINNKYELESNKVETEVVSSVTARYVDEDGNIIAVPEKFEGKINDNYTTEKKKIANYEFVRSRGETSGKYEAEPKEVVYVYRKIVKGCSVQLIKQNNNSEGLAGVKFELQKENGKKWIKYNKNDLITNSNGTIIVDNLEEGEYRFVEIETKDGYILDNGTVYKFSVSLDKNGNQRIAKPSKIVVQNEKPNAKKEITSTTTNGYMKEGESVGFKVTVDVPKIIDRLKTYGIVDTFDKGLDYNQTSLVIKGVNSEGKKVTLDNKKAYIESYDSQILMINFTTSELSGYDHLEITYSAKLNEQASMLKENKNSVKLVYSNIVNKNWEGKENKDKTSEVTDEVIVKVQKEEKLPDRLPNAGIDIRIILIIVLILIILAIVFKKKYNNLKKC